MSSVYFDALKDRLYCSAPDWQTRRSAQTALHNILLVLVRICAPVLVHTAEEVWSHVRHKDEETDSIHLCHWPGLPAETEESAEFPVEASGKAVPYPLPQNWKDDSLNERWKRMLGVRSDLARCVEKLREEKIVSNNMEVKALFYTDDDVLGSLLDSQKASLMELLMVSELQLGERKPQEDVIGGMTAGEKEPSLSISAARSHHPKCARCWNLRPTVGEDSRHPELCRRCAGAVSELR